MQRLHFKIEIDAPKEKVWDTMLKDETYRIWTDVFAPGSYYEGSWNKGSKILFLALDQNGNPGGMLSRIKENRQYEFISIEHIGMVNNGKEDTSSDEAKNWAGVHENYTFKEINGKTEVIIEVDSNENFAEMFNDMWPRALQKLKQLAEEK